MAITYSQLEQALQDYLENTEVTFVSQIPRFVRQAEDRINQSVQVYWQRKNQTGNMSVGNQYLSLPSDWISILEVQFTNASGVVASLLPKEVGFIREVFPTPATAGVPRYYALFDADTALIGPTPDGSYTTELHYYAKPPSIVDNGTSWLGDEFESVLLWGSLIEAYSFLKGDADLLKLYQDRYTESLNTLKEFAKTRGATDATRHGTPAALN